MGNKCCHTPLTEEAARELLSDNGINKTKVKISVLETLSRASHPLSVSEIHHLLKESCDVSTIFRTITQFKEKNLIREVNLDEGFFRYEMGGVQEHSSHHHHVRCRKCGEIRNIEKCDLKAFEKAIAKLGFKEMEHRLEFSGICSKCSR